MKLIRNPFVWLRRIRHRKGYGVHSPFAFQLITGVIYEQTPYYAYAELNGLHPWWVKFFGLYPLQCHRLLFRLANYIHPKNIQIIGATHSEAAYIREAVQSAHEAAPTPSVPSLVFMGHGELAKAKQQLEAMHTNSMLILEGIHHDAASLAAWKAIQDDPQTGITFDLYTYGLCFFNHSRHKQHYIVNF